MTDDPIRHGFGDALVHPEYLRQRYAPRLRDINFLHFDDLLAFLVASRHLFRGRVFDYGCGGAPYASLFSGCEYVRADIIPGATVDRLLLEDGRTNEPAQTYDLVVSTQVLEHVPRPEEYLEECFRILKPNGRLLLTTHGMFEEHGCPFDFHRWTAVGLGALVQNAGFQIEDSGKMTTELRALVQLVNQFCLHLRYPKRRAFHLVLALLRKAYLLMLMPLLNWLAGRVRSQRFDREDGPASIYVNVYVIARKPADITEPIAALDS